MTIPHGSPTPTEEAAGLPEFLAAVVRPGDRVLQIGPGTAAVQLAQRARRVVSVHSTLADVEAVRASLGPRGRSADAVDAQVGDLFEGRPDAAPYDLVVVTAGVRGISPRWLDQLAPGGVVVAPIALGGLHPWVLVGPHARDGLLYGRVLAVDPSDAGPPPADGQLYVTRPAPAEPAEPPAATTAPLWLGPLSPRFKPERYVDLWAWLAGQDDRFTVAGLDIAGPEPGCALVVGTSAVYVRPDGIWMSDAEPVTITLTDIVSDYVRRWLIQRQPEADEMTCRVDRPPTAGPDELFVAAGWTTARPVNLPR
ncbi:protein-L-isoaspartate O-methyltransferase [Kitasatospora sp. NPDC059648]|uniref:protein-L-isoaspartate O-methyltransferase family protein n=1 Tax=Kitasatospora sp. NPDC059648 TaxID=3346894 RepID=UPI0036ADD3A5